MRPRRSLTSTGGPPTRYVVTPFIGTTAQPATTVTGSPPATSTIVSGLTNSTTYTFVVSATNALGTGPTSTASGPVTPGVVPKAADCTWTPLNSVRVV